MCIRGKNLKVAAEILSTYENRLGAWTSPTAFQRLAVELAAQDGSGGAALLTEALDVVTKKGVKVTAASAKLALKACVHEADEALYTKAVAAIARVVDASALKALLASYPKPEAKVTAELDVKTEDIKA